MVVLPKKSINMNYTTSNIAHYGSRNERAKVTSQVMNTQVSGFNGQSRKNSIKINMSNPIGPRE